MDLRTFIINKRGDKTLKEFSKETGIPVGSVFTYEIPGYLEKASVTIISNVCRYYQIDPYDLPEFGYWDDSFVNEVIKKMNIGPDEELRHSLVQFIQNYKDLLNLADDEPEYVKSRRGVYHIEIRRKTIGKVILYYLPRRPLQKGRQSYFQDDFADFYYLFHDALNFFGESNNYMYFFLVSDRLLYYSLAIDKDVIGYRDAHIPRIRNNRGQEMVVYLIYSRYKKKFDYREDMKALTFLDVFWPGTKNEIWHNPELDIDKMYK